MHKTMKTEFLVDTLIFLIKMCTAFTADAIRMIKMCAVLLANYLRAVVKVFHPIRIHRRY